MKKIIRLSTLMLFLSTTIFFPAFAFDNKDILQLLSAKMNDQIIIGAIDAAGNASFDTSANGIIELTKAGASQAVISKILSHQVSNISVASNQTVSSGGKCNLEVPNMSEQLIMRVDGKLVPVNYQTATVGTSQSFGNALGAELTGGLSSQKFITTLRINGEHSPLKISGRSPEFLDLTVPVGSTPDDVLPLYRLGIKDKARVLKINTVESGVISGYKDQDSKDGSKVQIDMDTLSLQCSIGGKFFAHYRIRPKTPLPDGEYTMMVGNRAYTFSVIGG